MYFRMSRFLKKVTVTLLGAGGERQIEINARGGFPNRHIKSPRESVSSRFAREKQVTKPKMTRNPSSLNTDTEPTLFKVLNWMEASENHSGWLIIDEILFVATAHYKMKFNHTTLLDALRFLYQQGCLAYRLNRFDQHTFQLIENQENHLKSLLVEVDAILSKGGAS